MEHRRQPGNYGWPYCIGDNTPYSDWTSPTGPAGAAFDCAAPVNNSPNNTGLTNLPPVIAATVYYHYDGDPALPRDRRRRRAHGRARSTATTPT